jgi:hypothetical protein
MSLIKTSQLGLDGVKVKPEDLDMFEDLKELGDYDLADLQVELELAPDDSDEQLVLEDLEDDGAEVSGEIVVEVDDEPKLTKQFSFSLPHVPGGAIQDEIDEPDLEVDEDKDDIQVESDPWSWNLNTAMDWLQNRLDSIPKHSGRDVVGIERAISYLKKVLGEISKMVKSDYDNCLDVNSLEDARNEILNGLDRLEERLDKLVSYRNKKKKKADFESNGLVKEGQKAGGFQTNVSAFMAGLARLLINGHISAGHDIDTSFDKIAKKFKLTDREKFELCIVLGDMNFPVRRDRFYLPDEEIDTKSSDNMDWSSQHPA